MKTDALAGAMEREAWLWKRIQEHGGNRVPQNSEGIFAGMTSPEIRRECIRAAILSNGLTTVMVGTYQGKAENYGQLFQRWFGESIVSEKPTQEKRL